MNTSTKQILFGFVALGALAAILLAPTPAPIAANDSTIALSWSGKATLAVLTMAVILWATEALPFAITGLAAMAVLALTGAVPFAQLIQDGFGHPIILFFLGVLLFSAAISETNLLRRLTTFLLYHLGHRPKAIIFVFLAVGAMLSAWITDMAVAAVLTPIAVSILRDAGVRPLKSQFGRALMISCAWGPLIGGVATPAGCGPNPLTMGFLHDLAGIDFGFVEWMLVGFPAALMMLPGAWVILLKVFPIEQIDLTIAEEDLRKRLTAIGPVTFREIYTGGVFAVTIVLWIAGRWINPGWGAVEYISVVAIACACLLFLPRIQVLSWEQAERSVAWGGILLVVTGLSLGLAIYKTGAAEWLAWVAFSEIGRLPPVGQVFAVVLGVSLMKVMFSSNTVTGTIVVPLLIALAANLELDATVLAIPAGITASLAFILVTSTPTNVIPYTAGYFTIADMVKAGLWMTVVSSVCVTISICLFGKLFNIVHW